MTADRHDRELRREAIAWLRKLTSGRATQRDAAELRRWRGQSPAHAAAFDAVRHLWRDLETAGRNTQFNAGAARRAPDMPRSQPVVGRRMLIGGGLAAAAALGLHVAVRPPLSLWPSLAELSADYRTETGQRRDLAPFEGVSVQMNTRTSIALRSRDGDDDRLELLNGEATFAALRQDGRRLIVRAADGTIKAGAARFDVRYLGASVCVTCLDGTVDVESDGEAASVRAGHQLNYRPGYFSLPQAVDLEIATAWQRGLLVFRFTPLSDVVDEINRYRPGRIVVTNAALGRTPVSGRFRIDNLDEIVDRLEEAFGAKARVLPGGLVLLG